jgi:O-methyltransferase involved in polyketide biosynthesis
MHPMSAPETGMARQDLSVTALYTSATWSWGHLPDAELLVHPQAHIVFNVVNAVIALIRPFFPGLAPLRSSLVHRHMMIDRLVATSGARQVLELAAGLSRRGVSLSSDSGLDYTEVDAPHVIEAKRKLLLGSERGREALQRPNWKLIGADVTQTPLLDLAPNDQAPLVIVAEGLLMYLEAEEQRSLFKRAAERLRSAGGTLIFDLVPACEQPSPGAVGRALIWLMKRFTGGKAFVRDQRTRDDLRRDVLEAGFADVRLYEPTAVARAWDLPMPEAKTQQLLFVGRVPPLLPVP